MTRALLIDIGNSRIKWCRDDLAHPPPGAAAGDAEKLDEAWRGHDEAISVADVSSLTSRWSSDGETIDAAWISNVASTAVGEVVAGALRARWPLIRIDRVESAAREGSLVNGYIEPTQLGADRWMAALGAHALLPTHTVLVCSFGTATTIDLVECAQETMPPLATFVGGLILPGPETMRAALVSGTARLPDRVGRAGGFVDFADNTSDAIASGIVAAQVGAVARALHVARRRAANEAPVLMITGGAAPFIAPHLEELGLPPRIVADLVLRGLAIRARRTRDL